MDLTTLNLGKEEILALTTDVTLSDLKVLKIKMPLKTSYPTFTSIELLRRLSFNSKKLEQVHFQYCEDKFESQKQSLSCLLESFKCEIIPLCKFLSNILSNLNLMSRVTSFFTLSSLILVNCNIDDNGVQVLTKTKSGTNLKILRLDVNRITDTGVEILSNLLSESTELQHLSLSCNHIGNKGAIALAGALVAKA